jgi:carboxymethylenebutenolidase
MADVKFHTPDNELITGYIANVDHAIGNVVVLFEYWGLNDQIRAVCDRFAQANIRAFAPDLFDGKVIPLEDHSTAGAHMQTLDWKKAGKTIDGAVAQLAGMGGKVAITGFCLGGALTIAAAIRLGDRIAAAVPFYGAPGPDAGDPGTIKAPVLGHFAQHDEWVTPARVDELEKKLNAGGVKAEIHRYDAHHAFFNEARKKVHDTAASKLAWERTLAFLKKNLA